jgi:hypothetical protein
LKSELLTYSPFVLGTLVIIYLQMMLLSTQQIKPFPDGYGRETKLNTDATDAVAAQTVGTAWKGPYTFMPRNYSMTRYRTTRRQ